MALSLQVQPGYVVDDTKSLRVISGTLRIIGTGNYPANGLALDSVMLAIPEAVTNSGVLRCIVTSRVGSGYIWLRIAATGKLMGLQVPPSGSLTTAAPLQQLPSTVSDVTLQNESLDFELSVKRNA